MFLFFSSRNGSKIVQCIEKFNEDQVKQLNGIFGAI